MILINEIQIDIHGLTGVGKSHVMATIKRALEAEYQCAQVASYDLSVELNGSDISGLTKPNPRNTIFVLNEGRVSDYRSAVGKDKEKVLKDALRDLLNDCINFDGAKLTDSIMKKASDALKDT